MKDPRALGRRFCRERVALSRGRSMCAQSHKKTTWARGPLKGNPTDLASSVGCLKKRFFSCHFIFINEINLEMINLELYELKRCFDVLLMFY